MRQVWLLEDCLLICLRLWSFAAPSVSWESACCANRELVRYFIFNPSKRRRNVSSDEFSGFHEASEGSFTWSKIRHHRGDSTPAPRADQRNTTVEIPQQVLGGICCEASDEGLQCVAASPLFNGSSNIPRGLGSRTVYGGADRRGRSSRNRRWYWRPHWTVLVTRVHSASGHADC